MNAPPPGPPQQNPYLAPPPQLQQNPYAPPGYQAAQPWTPTEAGQTPLTSALYTPGHVSLATFLGSPLGGAILMAINEHRAQRKGRAVKTLLAGIVGTVLLLGIGIAIPDGVPTFPIGLLSLVLMGATARHTQGPLVDRHLAMGGRRASGWAAAGIGLLSAFAVFVPLIVVLVAIEMLKS